MMINLQALNIPGIEYIVYGLIIVFWVFCILWVTKDISARTDSLFLQLISIILVTFFTPIVGLPIYMVLRPVGYKYDTTGWREYGLLKMVECKECSTKNIIENNFCTNCGSKLKVECKECKIKFCHDNEYCPNCGAPNLS